jgi:hypothetical protein
MTSNRPGGRRITVLSDAQEDRLLLTLEELAASLRRSVQVMNQSIELAAANRDALAQVVVQLESAWKEARNA